MGINTASFANTRLFQDSFSIPDENPLSHGGIYTTSNYYYSVDGTAWDKTRVVSGQANLYAIGRLTESGNNINYAPAETESISLINGLNVRIGVPVKFYGKVMGDTRDATYNAWQPCIAALTCGIGAKSISPFTGLWITISHIRDGDMNDATPQKITISVGSIPFAADILGAQTLVAAGTDAISYYFEFIIFSNSINVKMWKTTDSIPASYTTFNFTQASSLNNSIFIGQRAKFVWERTPGDFMVNPVQHYLDDLEIQIRG